MIVFIFTAKISFRILKKKKLISEHEENQLKAENHGGVESLAGGDSLVNHHASQGSFTFPHQRNSLLLLTT